MIHKLAPYWKAVVGFVAPGAGFIIGAVLPGSDGGTAVTGSEWLVAACTAIVTSAGVYAATNTPPGPVDPSNGRHEAV